MRKPQCLRIILNQLHGQQNGKGGRVVLARDLRRFMVPMMSRCRGCRDTVKRVNSAWRGNTVAMMHYLRIVNSRGSQ
jgi:hypothetical protein